MKWSPLSEEEVIRQMGFSIQRHMHRMTCQDRMVYRSAFNQHRGGAGDPRQGISGL